MMRTQRTSDSRRPLDLIIAALALTLVIAPAASSWSHSHDKGSEAAFTDPVLLKAFGDGPPGARLPVIVVHEGGTNEQVQAFFEGLGVPFHTLDRLQMSLVHADLQQVQALADSGLARGLWSDEQIEFHLDDADGLVGGAQAARDASGITGQGVGVLVIDSGVDALHPDLIDRVVATAQPLDPMEFLLPDAFVEGVPYNDAIGHGTHVSGIVAGTGEGAGFLDPNHKRYVGMAPGADLVVWTIPGLAGGTHVFQALQGFEYALDNQDRFGLRVITNSWGIDGAYDADHPVNLASLEAYEAGMAVVFSAGNSGQPPNPSVIRLNMFAVPPWALSVAAANKNARLASFSSQGSDPDVTGRCWDHPDLTAPGVSIMAAKARAGAVSPLSPLYAPSLIQQDFVGSATHYQYLSGTSMSAPIVAGALALLFEANPDLAPDQAYDILLETANALAVPYDHWRVGAGMLDVPGALAEAITTTGTLDDFLQGAASYADPDDPCENPLNEQLGV